MTDSELKAYLMARTLYWRGQVIKLDAEAARRILAAIGKARNDMTARLLAEADGLAAVTDWNRERLAAVDAWLSELLAGTQAVAVATVTEAAVAVASASLATYGNILSFDGAASGVKNVGMSAEQLASWFQNTPLGGGTLKGWIDSAFSDGAKRSLLTTLQAGGLQGHGTGKMVKSVLETAILEGFSVTERQAVTLTRTFVHTANVQAMEAVYRKNSHIVKAMKWITALDNHVCPLCAVRDGVEWAMDEPLPPRHPGCRCVLVPVVRRDKLGVNDAQTDAKVKPVMRRWVEREEGAIGAGGKRKILNSGKMVGSYEDWWKTLPEAKQAVTFGPVRTRLLREGNIAWGDLLEKGSGRLRTLDELGYTLSGESLHKKFARDVMPNLDKAVIPAGKLTTYSLNPDHPRGGDKARVLMSALNLTRNDAEYFSQQIIQGLAEGTVAKTESSPYGELWRVLINVKGKNDHVESVTTGWIYKNDTDFPSLTTAYLKGKKVKS